MRDSMQIIIRDAVPEDAPDIARIHADGWEYAYRGIFGDAFLDAKIEEKRNAVEKRRAIISEGTTDSIHIVATDADGKVVGYVLGGKMSFSEMPEIGKVWRPGAIYLDPAYIGRGVGRTLMREFARRVADAGGTRFMAACTTTNKAYGFYKKLGGRVIKEIDAVKILDNTPMTIFEFDVNDKELTK
ncbi:MAG: GNAT family N-acetyltransferase [Alphaproteobacteria bacterium]|nr:GNAT family N-acetyltransferase [Alphaproteobacteria bacterium]MCL2757691.1 GNAT family N-acetyltransferase [Alphaproteobacteria bacterium]